jgi:hypothetical protein
MPRIARCQQHQLAAYCHMMNGGHNREVLLRVDDDFAHFLKLLKRYHGRFGQHLFHNCLMPNCFRILANCPSLDDLY